jgi:V8-like Glu-specific endopeptidase
MMAEPPYFSERQVVYTIDTSEGQSGAGVFDPSSGQVIAVHTGWDPYFGMQIHRGTRLNYEGVNLIFNWIRSDQ